MTYEIIPLSGIAKNIAGKVFGRLTAIAPVEKTKSKQIKWLCVCECGTETVTQSSALSYRSTRSCGCIKKTDATEQYWLHVNKDGIHIPYMDSSCWGWNASCTTAGYGQFYAGKQLYAHRFSWEAHHGMIPNSMFVLHRCDNPPCSNPDHLFLGDHRANSHDMHSKGRANPPAGVEHWHARLDEAKVRIIRLNYPSISTTDLGNMFGVSRQCVNDVVTRRTWKHI